MWLQFRPTFQIELKESRQTAVEKLQSHYRTQEKKGDYLLFGEYGELHIPPSRHRLWTPHLSFCITDKLAGGEPASGLIHCRYAPRIEVWTFVWIVYLAMAFTAFFGLILVCSQWQLGEFPWGWALTFPPLLVILGLYLVAHLGQQLSEDQMIELRDRLNRTLLDAQIKFDSAECEEEGRNLS
jgi:hypothetical protein